MLPCLRSQQGRMLTMNFEEYFAEWVAKNLVNGEDWFLPMKAARAVWDRLILDEPPVVPLTANQDRLREALEKFAYMRWDEVERIKQQWGGGVCVTLKTEGYGTELGHVTIDDLLQSRAALAAVPEVAGGEARQELMNDIK